MLMLYFNLFKTLCRNKLSGILDSFYLGRKEKVVIFYFPSDHEQISGGLLSIFYLYEKSKDILTDSIVLNSFFLKYPKVRKYTWLKNDIKISNIYYRKFIILRASKVLIHVPEVWIHRFRSEWNLLNLENERHKIQINILNQNQNYLPIFPEVMNNLGIFNKITMTLAFEKNYSYCKENFPGINISVLSAWLYNTIYEVIPFERKSNVVLISPDSHPLKQLIVNKLKMKEELKIFEMNFLPYDQFKLLQKEVKWTVTFGEGNDNYFQGAFLTGGIGFCVYNDTFFHKDFNKNNLPKVIFDSFEKMYESIDVVIEELDNKIDYERQNSVIVEVVKKYNNEELVKFNLYNFYKKNNFI